MKVQVGQLRKAIREALEMLREDEYEVSASDELDLGTPTIIKGNTYDMDDQETFTKLQNKKVNYNDQKSNRDAEEDSESLEEIAPQKWEDEIMALKQAKTVDNPFSLAKWMKKAGDDEDLEEALGEFDMPGRLEDNDWERIALKKMDGDLGREDGVNNPWDLAHWVAHHMPPGEDDLDEKAPPGWEKTVKGLKKHHNIDNPFALAWWMKDHGEHPHK